MKAKFTTALAGVLALLAVSVPAMAQELNVAVQNMSAYLDPGRDHSNVGSQHYYNSFDTLIEKDHTKSEPVWKPGLATSWKLVSPTAMEFKLRQGVKFHNGQTMTAEDVKYSIDRIIHTTFTPYLIRKKDFLPNIEKVDVVDAETIRISTYRAEPLFETLFNIQQTMIVPKGYMAGLSGDPAKDEPSDYEAFGLKPVGTGPYKITEFVPNQRVVYERFDDHWGEKAPFKKVTVRRIPELSARITALKNGEMDIITNVPPDQIKVIEQDAKLKAEGMVTPLFHVVIYNTQHPKMNRELRQAMNYAIDRKTMNEALWLNKAVVPNTHTYPQYGGLYMPELKTFEYDPQKAKDLLKQSGYDGFEIRYDTGSAYYTNALLAAQALQEMWAAVGIKVRINVDEAWTGNKPEMMTRNWSNPMYFPDPAGSFGTMWAPEAAAFAEGRFRPNDAYKGMWERFRFSEKLEDRKKAYAEMMDYIKNDPPVFVLWQPFESYGIKKSVNWKPLPGHIPYVLDFRAGKISVVSQ
jgi:peptide/nickel transport system substrate-binding protein